MEYENRLKGIRRTCYRRLKDGLGAKKNRIIRELLVETRALIVAVDKMKADYDYVYDFIINTEFKLSDLLWNDIEIELDAFEVEAEAEVQEEVQEVEVQEVEVEVEVQEVETMATITEEIEAISVERNETLKKIEQKELDPKEYDRVNNKLLEAIEKLRAYNLKRVCFVGG